METTERNTYCFECKILTDSREIDNKTICKECGRVKNRTTESLKIKRRMTSIFIGFLFILGWFGWIVAIALFLKILI